MIKTLFKISITGIAVAVLTGCPSTKPGADLYGSNGNMIGSTIEEGDLAMLPPGMVYPDNVNREMFAPLLFEYDSSQVSPQEAPKVEQVAQYLRSNKDGIIIEGHGDERGSREYNLALGERRALAVREYLISMGVDASRIQTNSKGEEDPAVAGHNEEAWRQNRRAVFGIYQ